MRLSGRSVGLLSNFHVAHLRDGIKRMVDGQDWTRWTSSVPSVVEIPDHYLCTRPHYKTFQKSSCVVGNLPYSSLAN
jgi:hypothetical protein